MVRVWSGLSLVSYMVLVSLLSLMSLLGLLGPTTLLETLLASSDSLALAAACCSPLPRWAHLVTISLCTLLSSISCLSVSS